MIRTERARHRVTQFFRTLLAPLQPVDRAYTEKHLSSALLACFERMSPAEQHHGIEVCKALEAQGYRDSDLLAAALLHDVGKSVAPPRLWERVVVVLGEHFFPTWAERWAQGEPQGWRRSFVVRHMHPQWGADIVRQAGASPKAVALIRRHHERAAAEDDVLLRALQAIDET